MNLKSTFDSIDLDQLAQLVAEAQEETLHLEFKQVHDPEMKSRDTRREFAKALSGFANADGGIVIWGVEAKQNESGIDCAIALRPTDQTSMFVAKLQHYTPEAVNPTADGIVHQRIGEDPGYVKSLVPASDGGPHMAKLGEDRYYKRSGSSFMRMEHFDIEDMMGRRARPVLRLTYRLCTGSVHSRSQHITRATAAVIGVENIGRGPARAPYLALRTSTPGCAVSQFGLDGNYGEGLPRLIVSGDTKWKKYGGAGDFVLHPGTTLEVTRVNCQFGPDDAEVPNLELYYELAAEGFRLRSDVLIVDSEELALASGA